VLIFCVKPYAVIIPDLLESLPKLERAFAVRVLMSLSASASVDNMLPR